jgi:hypothetical protein
LHHNANLSTSYPHSLSLIDANQHSHPDGNRGGADALTKRHHNGHLDPNQHAKSNTDRHAQSGTSQCHMDTTSYATAGSYRHAGLDTITNIHKNKHITTFGASYARCCASPQVDPD